MASVWEHRWSELVARVTGLRESTSLELLPDLMPVLQVLDPSEPELHLYRGERLCVGRVSVVAVAAQYSYFTVWNPVASGALVIVDRVNIYSPGAGVAYEPEYSGVQFGTPSTSPAFADVRAVRQLGGAVITRPQAILGSGTTASALGGGCSTGGPSSTPTTFEVGIVLAPGFTAYFKCDTPNTTLGAGVHWRERPVNAREREVI